MNDTKRTFIRRLPAPGSVYSTDYLPKNIKDVIPEWAKEIESKGIIEVYAKINSDNTVVPIYRWASFIQVVDVKPYVMEMIEYSDLWGLRELIRDANPKTFQNSLCY